VRRPGRVSTVVATAILLFLPAPILIVIASSFTASGFISFPPPALSLRWYARFLGDPDWLRALAASTLLATAASAGSVVAGFVVAWTAERWHPRLRPVLDASVMLPLVLPQAALGMLVLSVAGRLGLVGSYGGILLAHLMVTLPYAYRPLVTGIAALDRAQEEAAQNLGATPPTVFRRVTLPGMRPAIASALLFCFIISFDEATVTLFLVGPDATTLPIRIFNTLQDNADPVVAAISTLLIAVTVAMVLAVGRVAGLLTFVRAEGQASASGKWAG
jgi:putative spermidine/putrescine transport system permease protein